MVSLKEQIVQLQVVIQRPTKQTVSKDPGKSGNSVNVNRNQNNTTGNGNG